MIINNKKYKAFKNIYFIAAEIGINHNGSLDLAKNLIKQAAIRGANAVKFHKKNKKSYKNRKYFLFGQIKMLLDLNQWVYLFYQQKSKN